jgi:ABC-type branched-subunit amino acid transport system ATPase component
MLQITGLTAGYKDTRVVDGVDLSVPDGQMVAILGRNGVGKTTLLKSLFGLCRVFSGSIALDGAPIELGRPEKMARAGLSFMPDDRGVFATLTVEQNLRLARRRDYTPPIDVRKLFPLLTERAGQPAGTLSGGQKQQVGIARAILAGQRLIAIDEFSQGLQPSIAQAALEALRGLAATGVTVVLVEQSPELPLRYCDRITGMLKGRIVFDEPVATLGAGSDVLTDLLVVG